MEEQNKIVETERRRLSKKISQNQNDRRIKETTIGSKISTESSRGG